MSQSTQRIVAAFLGLLFLATGLLKAWDPAAFAIDIQNYRLLPWHAGALLALYLPWVEIVTGMALLLRLGYRGALWVAVLLVATFLAAYGSTRLRGLDVACGCFGHGVHRGFWTVMVGDSILFVLLILLLRAAHRPLSPVLRAGAPPVS